MNLLLPILAFRVEDHAGAQRRENAEEQDWP